MHKVFPTLHTQRRRLPLSSLSIGLGISGGLLLALSAQTHAQTASFMVSGSASPWLAGMPNGSQGVPYPGGIAGADTAPAQSPVQVTGLNIAGGSSFIISSTGLVSYDASNANGPEGNPGLIAAMGDDAATAEDTTLASWNGISGVRAPINALMGVFLDNTQPNLTAAPPVLDYSSASSRDLFSFTPQLKQVFYIGDGLTSLGMMQTFVAPTGASRFYLGTMDGFQWAGNSGSFTVQVTQANAPEPSTATLLVTGVMGSLTLMKVTTRLRGKKHISVA